MNTEPPVKILLVEDELIIGEHISRELQKNGFTVMDIITKGERVPGYIAKSKPDLIIMDINLAGQLDGIETAKIVAETDNIPVIFLTANADDQTFEKSKQAFPFAFIGKPFKIAELVRSIEMTLARSKKPNASFQINENTVENVTTNHSMDSIYIRDKEKMVKVEFSDVQYIEADRNYSKIYTNQKTFLVSSSLKTVEERINSPKMQRVHRSYMVNISAIDELDDHYVFINGQSIPVSKTYKKELNHKLKFI